MLRGVSQSSVPATGTWVFDILKQQSPCVLEDASGDMFARDNSRARHQVLAGIRGWVALKRKCRSGPFQMVRAAPLADFCLAPSPRAVYPKALSALARARPH